MRNPFVDRYGVNVLGIFMILVALVVAILAATFVALLNADGATCSGYAKANPELDVRFERWSLVAWDCVVQVDDALIPLDQFRGVAND